MRKAVLLDKRAIKEIHRFPRSTQLKFQALFEILETQGKLEEPFAKKLTTDLFEIRIKDKNQYRALYAYLLKNQIIILSAFIKKVQKTPSSELNKAKNRLFDYQ